MLLQIFATGINFEKLVFYTQTESNHLSVVSSVKSIVSVVQALPKLKSLNLFRFLSIKYDDELYLKLVEAVRVFRNKRIDVRINSYPLIRNIRDILLYFRSVAYFRFGQ